MNQQHDYFHKVVDWFETEKSRSPEDLVPELKRRLNGEDNFWPKKGYYYLLQSELVVQHKYEDSIETLRDEIEFDPEDAQIQVRLAELYLYYKEDLESALQAVDEAITTADRTGHFRRHAHAVKARILLKLLDYKRFEKTLLEIVSLKLGAGARDVGKENDFVERLPNGKVSDEVLEKYFQYFR